MVGADVLLDLCDELVVGVGADDLPALAVDDLRHLALLSVDDLGVIVHESPWRNLGVGASLSTVRMAAVVLATVVFTDIVGSTRRAAELGDASWSELLGRHHAIVRAELDRFEGEELDTAGDGFFVSFDSPGQAVRCAAGIVAATREIGLAVRAGVHTGECERVDGKLGGVAVHIGSRICAEASPSEVLVSSTVRDLLAGSGLAFVDRGLHGLRGIPGDWRLFQLELAPSDPALPTRIQLCGHFVIELDGTRVEQRVQGRQGEALFAYLVVNRFRPVGRDELTEMLWPARSAKGADSSLSALLSKLRRALGPKLLDGRSSLQLQLPERSWVDLEAAMEAIHRAESALHREDWPAAWSAARVTLHIARRPFLPGIELPWTTDVRRQLSDVYVRSLEVTAAAGLAIGGSELDTAQRSATSLIAEAPYRESGYRLLMETLAHRDNVAEALRVYEELRQRLRVELGTSPSAATQELHRRLLG
jgi:class 3 adenylate cyclase/DNA-binding SARP family transcriptional activator